MKTAIVQMSTGSRVLYRAFLQEKSPNLTTTTQLNSRLHRESVLHCAASGSGRCTYGSCTSSHLICCRYILIEPSLKPTHAEHAQYPALLLLVLIEMETVYTCNSSLQSRSTAFFGFLFFSFPLILMHVYADTLRHMYIDYLRILHKEVAL